MKNRIPIWIYLLQGLLTFILIWQASSYYLLNYPEVDISGTADRRAIYELAGRTTAMALVSIVVMLSRNPSYFVVLFLLDIFRESQEMFIDPLLQSASTDISPVANAIVHLMIVALELVALGKVYKLSRGADR